MNTIFYKCPTCGNVVVKIVDSKVPVVCCGKPMQPLEPNIVDRENRKYLPEVVLLADRRLRIDPCVDDSCTTNGDEKMFLYVEFESGGMWLGGATRSEILLPIGDYRPLTVYKYCSHHGLWCVKV